MAGSISSPQHRPLEAPCLSRIHPRGCIHAPSLFLTLPAAAQMPPPLKVSIRRRPARCSAARPDTDMEVKPLSDDRMLVFVPPHPLIKHWISVLRNKETPCAIFKSAMAELGRLLIYEASRDWLEFFFNLGGVATLMLLPSIGCLVVTHLAQQLPIISGEIQSPMSIASVEFIDPREPVVIVPILRAGLALAEYAASVLPATVTYHLGMCRDETTLEPSVYLNNLPENFPEGTRILVVDPMLATGGTIVAAIDLLKDRGANEKQIKVIAAVTAPPALQKLSQKFPGLHVYAGMIDPVVNEKGFIIPGLGDAGDRSFGT